MSDIVAQIRHDFNETDNKRDEGLTPPEDVFCIRDIVYGDDPKWQSLDIYRPADKKEGKMPVIVSVHGGGWIYGDKERYQFYCMDLARRGFAIVNFSYRLAPENQFPASLEDINSVFTWCLAHQDEYGLDMDNMFAVGDSAGAHLLSLYICIHTNDECASYYPFKTPEGLQFKAIALNCGLYHFDKLMSNERTRAVMNMVLPEGGSEREEKMISPDRFINSSFPRTFFMTAPKDYLLPQTQVLQLALLKANVDFTYRFYCDKDSSLGHVFHLNIKLDWSKRCNDEECDFFRQFVS